MKLLIVATILASTAAPAGAASYTAGPLTAGEPWSRPAAAGMTAAGFVTIANSGSTPDALVAVSSPAAARVEMHRSAVVGGVSRMEKVGRLQLPGGGAVSFQPGGYHLMLVGLKAPLKPGQRFPATLTFASGRKLSVAFTVSDGIGPPSPAHHH